LAPQEKSEAKISCVVIDAGDTSRFEVFVEAGEGVILKAAVSVQAVIL
jgi:hypothetical protein